MKLFIVKIIYLRKTKQNIINYYANKSSEYIEIDLTDKFLINSNIIVKKKRNFILIEINKLKDNINAWNICGEIVGNHNSEIYDMIINSDYNICNLSKDDICKISLDLFKVVSFDSWKNPLNQVKE